SPRSRAPQSRSSTVSGGSPLKVKRRGSLLIATSAASLDCGGCGQNDSGNFVGTRLHRYVARRESGRLGVDLFRHRAPEVGLDNPVLLATMYQDGLLFQAALVTFSSKDLAKTGP